LGKESGTFGPAERAEAEPIVTYLSAFRQPADRRFFFILIG
jgi:hypothetical protein